MFLLKFPMRHLVSHFKLETCFSFLGNFLGKNVFGYFPSIFSVLIFWTSYSSDVGSPEMLLEGDFQHDLGSTQLSVPVRRPVYVQGVRRLRRDCSTRGHLRAASISRVECEETALSVCGCVSRVCGKHGGQLWKRAHRSFWGQGKLRASSSYSHHVL